MIVLGAVLLVLAALLTLGTVFTNGQEVADLSVLGVSLTGVSAGGLFLAGLITGAVAMFALSLILGGGARKRHKKVQQKREVRAVQGQAETLEQENARLRDELGHTRSGGLTNGPGLGGPGVSGPGVGGVGDGRR